MGEIANTFLRRFTNWLARLRQCPATCHYAKWKEPVYVEWACVRNRFHFGQHRDYSGEWGTPSGVSFPEPKP